MYLLPNDKKRFQHTNEETNKVVNEQKSIIENLTQKVSELETANRRTIEQLTDEKVICLIFSRRDQNSEKTSKYI